MKMLYNETYDIWSKEQMKKRKKYSIREWTK